LKISLVLDIQLYDEKKFRDTCSEVTLRPINPGKRDTSAKAREKRMRERNHNGDRDMKTLFMKRIDRVAFVMALIVMGFTSVAGALSYQKRHSLRIKTGLTDDFHQFVRHKYGKEIDKTLKELDEVYGAIFDSDVRYANRGLGRTGLYEGDVFEYTWLKPSTWKVLASGFAHAALGFGVTLFAIRLTGRAMTHFFRGADDAAEEYQKEKEQHRTGFKNDS
jgi:hypothetical protein